MERSWPVYTDGEELACIHLWRGTGLYTLMERSWPVYTDGEELACIH